MVTDKCGAEREQPVRNLRPNGSTGSNAAQSVPSRAFREATKKITSWFKSQGWKPFPFQRLAWRSYLEGKHGLIHAQTGTGKTLAAFLGAVLEQIIEDLRQQTTQTKHTEAVLCNQKSSDKRPKNSRQRKSDRLKVLWITPLRALAGDTESSLRHSLNAVGVDWSVERRTSDTSSSVRARQNQSLPEVLVTTPESLTLQLAREDCRSRFSHLRLVVVDEWHELLGTKRGVQTELALARLRTIQPAARVWGLSATMGNVDQALATLVFPKCVDDAVVVKGTVPKRTEIVELIPERIDRFPWSGHLGQRMVPQVCELIRKSTSTLIFTNTRSQSEVWYRQLLALMPDMAGQMAVHHGSLDQELRHWIEERLRNGKLRCCVCTSSLELGVDYPAVDQVIQIGSPKGVARLLQRAGRSGHRPGAKSSIVFAPTHALELVEIAALKRAFREGHIERREPIQTPLDVLAQHVVTVALGGGFKPTELLAEVRQTNAFHNLSDQQWSWVMDFLIRGGSSLQAYPDFHRIVQDGDVYRVASSKLATAHKISIGTIVADAAIQVRFLKGMSIGTVEESFVGRLKPGDRFLLGGKLVELVRIHDNTAWVRRSKGKETAIPRWQGGRMPLSSELSHALRCQLEQSLAGIHRGPAMRAIKPLLDLQKAWSVLPGSDELLIERWRNREGYYLFVYPFEGRLVHEGLAALWAFRLSRLQPVSFSMAMNDYGFLLVSPSAPPIEGSLPAGLLSIDGVCEDILGSLNSTEMCKRQFREIARIAGLISQGPPGYRKQGRHLQASSNLFYDVFSEYDPDNLLLCQARSEVMDRQLEQTRLIRSLERLGRSRVIIQDLPRPTPLAFPLLADRLQDRLSSESFTQKIARMLATLNAQADADT